MLHDLRTRLVSERGLAYAGVIAAVLFRSIVFTVWEQARFDSDEAVMGLMAKHLSELRAFPVFFYGQHYILGVQAWMAAPVFLIAGPSVAALRFPLVIVNVAVAVLLVRILMTEVKLRPALAVVASLFFVLAVPGTASELLRAYGGSVEPILYVLLIWLARERPVWLGLVLGIGFLHREFTVYAYGALLLVELLKGSLFKGPVLLKHAVVITAAVATMSSVNVAKQFSSAAGPNTTIDQVLTPATNLAELDARMCIDPATVPGGLKAVATSHWAWLFGLQAQPVVDFGVNATTIQGVTGLWVVMLMLASLVATCLTLAGPAVLRAARDQGPPFDRLQFPIYLSSTGLASAFMYAIGRCGVISIFTIRYDLLSVLIPIGLMAAFFTVERNRRLMLAAVVLVSGWAAVSAFGHGRLLAEYVTRTPVNRDREAIAELNKRQIRYGTADYWIAYRLTFLSKERIILAATGVSRIYDYNRIVASHRQDPIFLSRRPCGEGPKLADGVYLC
ncbi:MAG TPA: hypothetical protein VH701_21775 [Vicinamibacterales bacterium]